MTAARGTAVGAGRGARGRLRVRRRRGPALQRRGGQVGAAGVRSAPFEARPRRGADQAGRRHARRGRSPATTSADRSRLTTRHARSPLASRPRPPGRTPTSSTVSTGAGRDTAASWLVDAAVRSVHWGGPPVPFPGLPERSARPAPARAVPRPAADPTPRCMNERSSNPLDERYVHPSRSAPRARRRPAASRSARRWIDRVGLAFDVALAGRPGSRCAVRGPRACRPAWPRGCRRTGGRRRRRSAAGSSTPTACIAAVNASACGLVHSISLE